MILLEKKHALAAAVSAAKAAGRLMRLNLRETKKINSSSQHDIKLELDVRCQKLIEKRLHRAFPEISLLGEEGVAGEAQSDYRWVVDPIDGTVNFTYGIPHACVSIALQRQVRSARGQVSGNANYETVLGVIYDPFTNELWTAICGQPARLNGQIIRVSNRRRLEEAVVSIGFAKSKEMLDSALPYFNHLVYRVRKIRMMGSAALGLAYVATGRLDAYIEAGISIWDVAAGGLIIECAGGEFWRRPIPGKPHGYRMIATNGLLRRKLTAIGGGQQWK